MPDIYERLGVRPLLNAAGTFSYLGGSRMPETVIQAWQQASTQFVDMEELLTAAGQFLAERLGAEACLVTGGAASGLMLGTAAALTARYPDYPQAHREPIEPRPQVLRLRHQRDLYDRQLTDCGVEIVDVDDLASAEQHLSSRTVLLMSYLVYSPESSVALDDWISLAGEHHLPTLVDAAADVPPLSTIAKLARQNVDMISVSGGKAICGPQSSGMLLGKASWINHARQNAFPHEGIIGRVAKVSKEDIAALCAAVEWFENYEGQLVANVQAKLQAIADCLVQIPTVEFSWITPPVANHFPHLCVTWDTSRLGLDVAEVRCELHEGSPRIATDRVYGTGTQGLLLSAINLRDDEAAAVGARLRSVLQSKLVGDTP